MSDKISDQPIRCGVVGLGRAGWSIHVGSLRPRTDFKIVAVCDPLAQRRKEAATEFGCKTYSSISRLIKQDDVELVIIATPSNMHSPDTLKAFKAGKHVVIEKPMAVSVAQADRMIAAADTANRKLFVHQNRRFARDLSFLEDLIQSGIIGRVYHIRNHVANFNRRNDWQTLAKNGGGVLNNTGPHNLDQVLQLLGAPVKQVMGDLQQIASAGDVEDHVKALIRAENGVTADLEISSVQNIATPIPSWIICGSLGTATVIADECTIRYFDPKQAPPLDVIEGAATGRKYGNTDKLPWQEKVVPAQGPDRGTFYDNVYEVLRHDKPMRVTPQSVREVIRTIALIRKGTNFSGKPKK